MVRLFIKKQYSKIILAALAMSFGVMLYANSQLLVINSELIEMNAQLLEMIEDEDNDGIQIDYRIPDKNDDDSQSIQPIIANL